MADIFISYKREEQPIAKKLADALHKRGWTVWWDPEIRAGERFDDVIEKALIESKCVVVLWSKLSVESQNVKDEATYALNRDKLVPILIEEVNLPFRFERINTGQLIDWDGSDKFPGFQKFIADVISILGEPPVEEEKRKREQAEREAERKLREEDQKRIEAARKSEEERKQKDAEDKRKAEEEPLKSEFGKMEIVEPTSAQKTITNSIGMKFVLIPAGKFVMGSPPDELGRKKIEKQHEVIISKSFYLQTTPVSQGQWKRVIGSNPSEFKHCGDDCPVEMVSWDDAQEFIEKLNQRTGINKYRLPTESEWEYACRAGTETAYSFGNEVDKLSGYAWFRDNSEGQTHPLRKKKPNAWGLRDMHGNVWEWCQDWFGDYPSGRITDPLGPAGGEDLVLRSNSWKILKGVLKALITGRVLRGGSWGNDARFLRSALRHWGNPIDRYFSFGFRVARDF